MSAARLLQTHLNNRDPTEIGKKWDVSLLSNFPLSAMIKKNTCPSFPVCNMKHVSCFPPAFIISSLPWQDIFHIAWLDNYSFITYISHAVILWLMCEGVRWESAHSRHLRFALKGHCWKIWWVTECVTDWLTEPGREVCNCWLNLCSALFGGLSETESEHI